MAKVILTARVKSGKKWEKAFRTHGDLFRSAGIGLIEYTIADGDFVVMCTDVADVDGYLAFLKSESTREAMKEDGVKRKSVQVYVLDQQFVG